MNNFIWNRQKKRSFPACGAAVKFYFIAPHRAAEKPTKRGSAPGPGGRAGGGGGRPQASHWGLFPLEHLPPFRQRQVCYDNDVILPRMCPCAVKLSAI